MAKHTARNCPGPMHATIIIGTHFSTCGCCGENAWISGKVHDELPDNGKPGCGVRYKYVSGDSLVGRSAHKERPDLEYTPLRVAPGITTTTEQKVYKRHGMGAAG